MGFLTLLAPLLGSIFKPLQDWIDYKKQKQSLDREISLKQLEVQSAQVVAQAQADTATLGSRLGATSQDFKQNTFWFLCVPILFTVVFPSKAAAMWHNFELIPVWVQTLFQVVYYSIWGIPLTKQGYGWLTDMLQAKREFKVEKIKALNEVKLFDTIRQLTASKTLSQQDVEAIRSVIDGRE